MNVILKIIVNINLATLKWPSCFDKNWILKFKIMSFAVALPKINIYVNINKWKYF